jgi:uncharacterized membrane protein YphA (DoxX/SURF4 family)
MFMKVAYALGRLVFGGFFLYNGVNHFLQRKQMAQYVAAKNVPMPDAAVTVTGLALTLGGASLVLGIKPQFGAAAVAGFLVGVSPIMHDFWNVEEPRQRQSEMINFGKNMALLGGSLALLGAEEEESPAMSRMLRSAKRAVAA